MTRAGPLILLLSAVAFGSLHALDAAARQTPDGRPAAAPMQAPADAKAFSPTLEDVPYPYPVQYLSLTLYGHHVRMAYMDVPADAPASARTVVLLHGMNFYGEYWSETIAVLHKQGFIPYTLSDMAMNTRTLLEHVGVQKAAIVGHSMGGMVATRFALVYPDVTERLVLYNQIGLTDARLQRPPTPIDQMYTQLLGETCDQVYRGIAKYFPSGVVPAAFEKYVRRQYGWTLSGNWPEAAMVRALVQQMVYEDPVVYDWAHIKVKTPEIGGDKDGPDFPALARHVADTIPGAQLVLIPGIGHVPHVQSPDIFHRELLKFLGS